MNRKFKLALIQMKVEGGNADVNLARAADMIGRAASAGARVAILPECLDLGWTDPSSLNEARPVPEGVPFKKISSAAGKNGIYVCAGLTEKAGDLVYNSAVLVDPAGQLVLLHRKINELDIGHRFYSQGGSLNVVPTEYGNIGVMICADAFSGGQVISRSLCYMGADIILSPCSWAVSDPGIYSSDNPYGKIWRENYGPVSETYDVWIAGVSNVGDVTGGPWKGKKCIGSSLLYGPGGKELLQGSFGESAEEIIYHEIEAVQRPYRGHDWRLAEEKNVQTS